MSQFYFTYTEICRSACIVCRMKQNNNMKTKNVVGLHKIQYDHLLNILLKVFEFKRQDANKHDHHIKR